MSEANEDKLHCLVRHWKCRQGHVTHSERKPARCEQCRRDKPDLWLSFFTEVKMPNVPHQARRDSGVALDAIVGQSGGTE